MPKRKRRGSAVVPYRLELLIRAVQFLQSSQMLTPTEKRWAKEVLKRATTYLNARRAVEDEEADDRP